MTIDSLVSIIVPSFNQGEFIRKTLESIFSQCYRSIEVLVIDGASTDETVEILHSFRGIPELHWISEPDSGVVEAVNKGLAMAKGRYAAIQSSDDFYLPGAISSAIRVLQHDPSLGFVFGDIVKVDSKGHVLQPTKLMGYTLENVLAVRTWIPQPSTFFRLELAQELGGWREEVPYAADTDLWLRMAFRADGRKIDQLMAARRIHDAQRDNHGDRIVRDYTRMLEELEPLVNGPAALRRVAEAGRLRTIAHYQTPKSYWAQWWLHLYTTWLDPQELQTMDPMSLVPGWYPLRGKLSALRRKLLR